MTFEIMRNPGSDGFVEIFSTWIFKIFFSIFRFILETKAEKNLTDWEKISHYTKPYSDGNESFIKSNFLIGKNFHKTVWLVPRKFLKLKNTGQVPMILEWKKFPQSRLSRTPEIGILANVWKKFPQFANKG